jgi:integral membrane protein
MTAPQQLRVIGALEGGSLLLLLFVAMPLKYLGHLPSATRWVGSIHGIFVLALLASLARMVAEAGWSLRRAAKTLLVFCLPFGAFRRGDAPR